MAVFHGFEIENLHSFNGREGIASQGTVYLNGEELGFWSDDADGGPHRYDFPHELLDELIGEQVPELALDYGSYHVPANLDMLLLHLADLLETEEKWYEVDKKGCALVSLKELGYGKVVYYTIRNTGDIDSMEEIVSETSQRIAIEEELSDYNAELYYDEECFVVGKPLEGCEEALEQIREHRERVARCR